MIPSLSEYISYFNLISEAKHSLTEALCDKKKKHDKRIKNIR